MEPMALGSPPSSPGTSPTTNPNFLPAFLMGETQAPSPRTTNLSPSKNKTVTFKPSTPIAESRDRSRYFSQSPQETPPAFNISAVSDKSGPPARGLFDTLDVRNEYTSPNKEYNPVVQRQSYRYLNESLNKSYKRQVQDTPGSMWVTVLGFPPHAASLILSHFAQCGSIVERKFPPEGNWVHLKYSSQYEAAKALSFNGKLISNSIMIGVIPCTVTENKENTNTAMNMSANTSVMNDNLIMNNTSNNIVSSPNRVRSLNQSYSLYHNSTDVLPPANLPQKSTGLVSKAMEYVFGW